MSDPSRPTTVTVSPFATDLTALGETVQLTAEVRDQNARVMPTATVTWSSSNTSVATVDQAGLVTAIGAGTAAITATAGPASASAGITVTSDREYLVALYEATDGPNWINSENWLTDAPLGEWYGVDTDASGRVVRLDLAENGLSGPIPSALGSLTSLEDLRLRTNDLTGPIPPELGRLTSLTVLNMWRNDLTGPIPSEFGRLTRLIHLGLRVNDLTGPIPVELSSLTHLRTLHLGDNGLSGAIPVELGNLTRLRELHLPDNGLSGPIPPALGNLASLEELSVRDNSFSGPFPHSFLELDNLNVLEFRGNAGLCAPTTTAFRAWLQGIQRVSGAFCAASSASN